MPSNNPDQLIKLASVPSEADAAPIIAALKEDGIPATMTGGFTAGFIAEAPGDIQINILEKDLEKAAKVLRRFESENDAIDWNQVDVGEPETKEQ